LSLQNAQTFFLGLRSGAFAMCQCSVR